MLGLASGHGTRTPQDNYVCLTRLALSSLSTQGNRLGKPDRGCTDEYLELIQMCQRDVRCRLSAAAIAALFFDYTLASLPLVSFAVSHWTHLCDRTRTSGLRLARLRTTLPQWRRRLGRTRMTTVTLARALWLCNGPVSLGRHGRKWVWAGMQK